ncbi:MAG: hypothetical protein M1308_13640 [Actinobacteria bacterium]|nr:hypothetical protein [Actinomycetota bacterium]
MSEKEDLILKICKLHFINHLSHVEIASQLKLSRFQIGRLIRKAFDDGIVTIKINEPVNTDATLERYLEKEFAITTAMVVKNIGLQEHEMKEKIGVVAANYLKNIIKQGDIIGAPWGSTVREVINALPQISNRKVEVVQIGGGTKNAIMDMDCRESAIKLATKLSTNPHLLNAPMVVDCKETCSTLMNDSNIKNIFSFFDKMNIAIMGVGSLYPVPNKGLIESGNISLEECEYLKNLGAVGNLVAHFFDINGNFIHSDIEDRLIAISIETISRIPYTIAVAGGSAKARAILGLLRSNSIKILVTDSTAAEEVLSLNKKNKCN